MPKTSTSPMAPRRCPVEPEFASEVNQAAPQQALDHQPCRGESSAASRTAGVSRPSAHSSRSSTRPGRLGGSARAATSSGESGDGRAVRL